MIDNIASLVTDKVHYNQNREKYSRWLSAVMFSIFPIAFMIFNHPTFKNHTHTLTKYWTLRKQAQLRVIPFKQSSIIVSVSPFWNLDSSGPPFTWTLGIIISDAQQQCDRRGWRSYPMALYATASTQTHTYTLQSQFIFIVESSNHSAI